MTDPNGTVEPSVLLEFRVTNVRSFRHPTVFSLKASSLSDDSVVRVVDTSEVGHPLGVLPAAGVYGANGSGKTNLLRAMEDLRAHVLHSFRLGSPAGGVYRHPFRLDPASGGLPSTYEIELVLRGVRHEYGFAADDERYVEEWAYRFPRGRRALLFHRRDGEIELAAGHRSRGRTIAELLRPNALFLSTAASLNHPDLLPLYRWFARNLVLADDKTRTSRQSYTAEMLATEDRRDGVLDLLRLADIGIVDASKEEIDPVMRERIQRATRVLMGEEGDVENTDDAPGFPDLGVRLAHRGTDGAAVELDGDDESLGTLVWFGVVGPVLDALAEGSVFLADELDASLHPYLTRQLVLMFQSQETNPRRAQLVFNSHDSTLLGDSAGRVVGRDQVWFADKSPEGATTLTQLAHYRPRDDEALGRRYLKGIYTGLPHIDDDEVADAVRAAIRARADLLDRDPDRSR